MTELEDRHAKAALKTAEASLIQAKALDKLTDSLVDVVALVKDQLLEEAKAKEARRAARRGE